MAAHSDLYKKIGHLIRVRREEARVTQEELGARVRLTRTSIGNFESGRQRIQIDKLYDIADVLKVQPAALLPPRDAGKPSAATAKMWRGLRLPKEVREWVVEMSTVSPQRFPSFGPRKEIDEIRSTVARGKMNRRQAVEFCVERALLISQAKEPPVPVDKIASDLGIALRLGPYQDEGEVVSFILEQTDEVILGVNSSKPITRQRFAIAHSLGHLLLRATPEELHLDTDFRVDAKPAELEANMFASELLLPTEWLQREMARRSLDFENEVMISELAGRYKVSTQVLTTRLLTLPSFAELSPGKKAWATKQRNIAFKLAAEKAKIAKES